MMYDRLKNIAATNNWFFYYGRRDFANLQEPDAVEVVHLFVDPITTQENFDIYGSLESTTYSGRFMLVYSSQLDEDYEEKYLNHIKPILDNKVKQISADIACSELSITSWSITEVINVFSNGFDGILVNYTTTQEV